MAKKEIEHIRITPNDDGSHSIEHSFKRIPERNSKKPMGIGYERPDDESYSFGPQEKEQHRLLTHIAQTLGFKKVAAAEDKEDKRMATEGPKKADVEEESDYSGPTA